MLRKISLLLMLFVFSSLAFGLDGIVQGPFEIDGGSSIYIKKESNIDYPLGLYLQQGNKSYKVDSYETNGDTPNVESVFFVLVNKVKNIVVLISWHQEHRAEKNSGNLYQIYGYAYENKELTPNLEITNDPNLSGQDGTFNGDELIFKYKNAASIKNYLKNKFG